MAVLVLFGYEGKVSAGMLIPTYYWCGIGCTCTVDPDNWQSVTIDCEEVAPVDECPYDAEGSYLFCADIEWQLEYYWYTRWNTCVVAWGCDDWPLINGCYPTGLEPPTHNSFSCGCQLSAC
jgi:hypothetical protein